MRLVVSIASRGRPAQLVETVKRNLANCALANTLLFVAVDADDFSTIAALDAMAHRPESLHVSVAPREDTIAAKWNRALAVPADAYLALGDDDPIATQGFDAKILEAAAKFPDGIGMVYGHLANASFSGVVAPTAKFCEKMGNTIFPEYFPYWFCDHWTDDVAKIIGRISFADVKTDQSKAGKTQELREPAWWATWFDAAYLMRRAQARAIICAEDFAEPLAKKEILAAHHPLIEYRSKWINDHVRAQARQLEGWSGLTAQDERYRRVKAKAVAMIPRLLGDYGMDATEAGTYRNLLLPPTNMVGLRRAFA